MSLFGRKDDNQPQRRSNEERERARLEREARRRQRTGEMPAVQAPPPAPDPMPEPEPAPEPERQHEPIATATAVEEPPHSLTPSDAARLTREQIGLGAAGADIQTFTGPIEEKRFVDVSENSYYWYFVVFAWLPIYGVIYWAPRLL